MEDFLQRRYNSLQRLRNRLDSGERNDAHQVMLGVHSNIQPLLSKGVLEGKVAEGAAVYLDLDWKAINAAAALGRGPTDEQIGLTRLTIDGLSRYLLEHGHATDSQRAPEETSGGLEAVTYQQPPIAEEIRNLPPPPDVNKQLTLGIVVETTRLPREQILEWGRSGSFLMTRVSPQLVVVDGSSFYGMLRETRRYVAAKALYDRFLSPEKKEAVT